MTIYVTGATGLLGRALMRQLGKQVGEQPVIGLGLSRAGGDIVRCDLTDSQQVNEVFDAQPPTIIIHAAAHRDPDICEHDDAATTALNIEATRTLVKCANAHHAWLIYISTDYVFDGRDAPYAPDATPNPLNGYGVSKLAGEDVVRESAHEGLVVRVPVLYGQVETIEESAVTVVGKHVLAGETKPIDHWGVRFPTHTDDIAQGLKSLMEQRATLGPITGTLHISAPQRLTKYEQACIMAEVLGKDDHQLVANPDAPGGAPRPRDCQLDTSRFSALVGDDGVAFRSFQDGIRQAFQGLGLI